MKELHPDAGRIFAALRSLPSRQRDILILARLECWTYERIAYHQSITPEQVEQELAAALLALPEALEADKG